MPMGESWLLFAKAVETITLIKLKRIRMNTVKQTKSIIKIYILGNLVVKNLIMV